jgi:hypothetical protein
MRADGVDRLLTVSSLGDHGDVRFGFQNQLEPGAHQRLIIGQQYPDAHDPRPSRMAWTRNPPSGWVPTSR